MAGNIWKYSDDIDDVDLIFMQRSFVTYQQASEYYGYGIKPITRMAWKCGAVFKVGKKVLIKREIFEEYLRSINGKDSEVIEYV